MNALPGRLWVDVAAADEVRARSLRGLCLELGRLYYPHHDDRVEALSRQLELTAWHVSSRATLRVTGAARSLFALVPEHLREVRSLLVRSVYRFDLDRFVQVTGVAEAGLRGLEPQVLLDLAVQDDLLAAALATEVYRLYGPLPWRRDPHACAETWANRYWPARGPERERLREGRIRAFEADGNSFLQTLRGAGPAHAL